MREERRDERGEGMLITHKLPKGRGGTGRISRMTEGVDLWACVRWPGSSKSFFSTTRRDRLLNREALPPDSTAYLSPQISVVGTRRPPLPSLSPGGR